MTCETGEGTLILQRRRLRLWGPERWSDFSKLDWNSALPGSKAHALWLTPHYHRPGSVLATLGETDEPSRSLFSRTSQDSSSPGSNGQHMCTLLSPEIECAQSHEKWSCIVLEEPEEGEEAFFWEDQGRLLWENSTGAGPYQTDKI